MAYGDTLSTALVCLFSKSRHRFLPIYTSTVVHCVASTAAIALRLLPRDTATTGELRARTCDAPGIVSAVTLRFVESLAALAL